ncbi:glycosyltransferase, partial [Pseudomonadota bacterium]
TLYNNYGCKRKRFMPEQHDLLLLARTQEDALQDLEQVVLLGHEAWNKIGSAEDAARILREAGLRTNCITDLDSKGARQYLIEHTRDSLVVIPSLEDNYPYVVVEASLIDGLNLIFSNTGGIPEILGSLGNAQLFRPCAQDLATKLAEWLRHGRVAADRLGQYDARAANQRWLAFHDEVSAYARGASFVRTPESVPTRREKKSLDLCIPYFNHGRYLPQLLLSLEHQTRDDFNVIVIDDGSTDPESIRVFEAMRQKYSPRGWSFLHQENAFVDTARNTAVAHGTAEFISFLDADDIAALNLVERLLEAIHLSGDDCLMTCYCEFSEEEFPIDLTTGIRNTPCVAYKRPIGVDLLLSLADPDVLGSPVMIVRRSAYEAVGGFTEMEGAGHEDHELYIKLEFAGFRVDVLAEPLQLKRADENNLFSTTDKYLASMRIVRAYEERLREVNLEGLAGAFLSLSREAESLRERVYKLERPVRAWQKLLMPLRHVRRVYIQPVFRKLRQIWNG